MNEDDLDALLLVEDASQLTDQQVRYLRDNPELMSLIGDRESLGSRHLWWILVVAVLLVALSKVLATKFDNAFDQFAVDVVVDLVFEMGAALIGSVATVIFIKHRERKQFVENLRFRAETQRRIAALDAKEPE
ncbi:hypothetical protein [Paracoccus sp. SCSIO 75233]|uniref:hypothetical protein n=1 Tax=Paracoccus sp. SCSIO 75233 TaxID=3017782 RepID=UPI0022F0492F|nr:hypothetical protein [Paracoccus sp. SCSIO 75233]WBU53634.1 hypothetical protein PAF12_01995 [Paracoccus sp. SCSIO 75233]